MILGSLATEALAHRKVMAFIATSSLFTPWTARLSVYRPERNDMRDLLGAIHPQEFWRCRVALSSVGKTGRRFVRQCSRPAMPLPKDTVGCLTNVSLGEVFHRRYHQHSSFPSLMAHAETR
jgi:hypothetical protein